MKKIITLLLVFSLIFVASCAPSDKYPSSTIKMVIPYGIGGTTDKVGRELAKSLEKELGQKIIIVNQKGASGSIATKSVFDASSDGYTLLFSADSLGTQRVMGLSELSYDDFYPVLVSANDPKVIVVNKESKYKTIDDLLADMKDPNKKVKMSYTGPGGSGHVQSLIYKKYGYDAELIPFSGGMECIVSLLGGQVDFTNANFSTVKSYIESGELRLLAVASNERLESFPDVKALSEVMSGSEDYMKLAFTPLSLLVKKDTPDDVKNALVSAARNAVKQDEWNHFVESNMIDPLYKKYGDEKKARAFYKDWESKVCYLLKDAGVTKFDPEKFGIKK